MRGAQLRHRRLSWPRAARCAGRAGAVAAAPTLQTAPISAPCNQPSARSVGLPPQSSHRLWHAFPSALGPARTAWMSACLLLGAARGDRERGGPGLAQHTLFNSSWHSTPTYDHTHTHAHAHGTQRARVSPGRGARASRRRRGSERTWPVPGGATSGAEKDLGQKDPCTQHLHGEADRVPHRASQSTAFATGTRCARRHRDCRAGGPLVR